MLALATAASAVTASPVPSAVPATVSPAVPPGAVSTPPIPDAATVVYALPLPEPIVLRRGFEQPPTPYSAGHRGVDLAARSGQPVRAAADGRASFAGEVAGRGVVVITHGDGIRTEYEPVSALVSAGAVVRRGDPIGTLAGDHHDCAPDPCLHWGARFGDRYTARYIDPLALLRPLGAVRLLPWATEAAEAAGLAIESAPDQARG